MHVRKLGNRKDNQKRPKQVPARSEAGGLNKETSIFIGEKPTALVFSRELSANHQNDRLLPLRYVLSRRQVAVPG
jgi:hypothetical protein